MTYLLFIACSHNQEASLEVVPTALEVRASNIDDVSVFKNDKLIVKQHFLESVEYAKIDIEWNEAGSYLVLVEQGGVETTHTIEVPEFPELSVLIEAPIGSEPIPISENIYVSAPEKSSVQLMIHMISRTKGFVDLQMGENQEIVEVHRGRRTTILYEVQKDQKLTVLFDGETQQSNIMIKPLDPLKLAEELEVAYEYFPSEPQGHKDLSKSRDSIYVGGVLENLFRRFLKLGRYKDPTIPYAFSSVAIRNKSKQDYNLVVQSRVLDRDGELVPAFKPKSRQGQALQGWSRVLVRVPSESEAFAMVPLYFDPEQPNMGPFERDFEIYVLGQTQPIIQFSKELRLAKSSPYVLWGTVVGFLSALSGLILFRRIGGSFSQFSIKQLVSTSSFAAMIFTATATAYILSMSLSAALGPFAIMITSVVDALFRVALLVTLLSIYPFVGTFSLCTIVGLLLSSIAFGGVSPVDGIYVFGRIFWAETLLWVVGITRHRQWLLESRMKQSVRFALALVGTGLLHTATALALQVSLFRLYYADWYVAMILLGPNALYIAASCWLSIPFANRVKGLIR